MAQGIIEGYQRAWAMSIAAKAIKQCKFGTDAAPLWMQTPGTCDLLRTEGGLQQDIPLFTTRVQNSQRHQWFSYILYISRPRYARETKLAIWPP